MTTIGVYLRISDDRDGQQEATNRQRMDCESYAKSKGWQVADVFEDEPRIQRQLLTECRAEGRQ